MPAAGCPWEPADRRRRFRDQIGELAHVGKDDSPWAFEPFRRCESARVTEGAHVSGACRLHAVPAVLNHDAVGRGGAQAIEPIFKSLGGALLGYWYTLGGAEVYVLYELPDDITATGLIAKVTASGAFSSVSSTRLLTVAEMLPALGGSGTTPYRAPGQPG